MRNSLFRHAGCAGVTFQNFPPAWSGRDIGWLRRTRRAPDSGTENRDGTWSLCTGRADSTTRTQRRGDTTWRFSSGGSSGSGPVKNTARKVDQACCRVKGILVKSGTMAVVEVKDGRRVGEGVGFWNACVIEKPDRECSPDPAWRVRHGLPWIFGWWNSSSMVWVWQTAQLPLLPMGPGCF